MIRKVMALDSGLVAVFDHNGQQMPGYQGPITACAPAILRDAPDDATFQIATTVAMSLHFEERGLKDVDRDGFKAYAASFVPPSLPTGIVAFSPQTDASARLSRGYRGTWSLSFDDRATRQRLRVDLPTNVVADLARAIAFEADEEDVDVGVSWHPRGHRP